MFPGRPVRVHVFDGGIDDDKIRACIKKMSPGRYMQSFKEKNISKH